MNFYTMIYMDKMFARLSFQYYQEQLDFKNVFILTDLNTLIICNDKFSYERIEHIIQRKMIDNKPI